VSLCTGPSRCPLGFALLAATFLFSPVIAHAQGILAVTPGSTVATTAGTGAPGYSGDGGAATAATLATPGAVAYDSTGNLFIADTNNHVIREVVKATGNIATVAGTGIAGFSGDGGAATAAQLDTPTGIAVDASGNLYIADSHNQRIRKVSGGNITTVAGNGTAGFAGDGAAATAAELSLPSGVAVDASGNVYIADTDNQRIRIIAAGTITTIAGTGEQSYTGDNAAATAATLDSPTGLAVDSSGNVYIADRHNQRIREIATSTGIITTLAGSGTVAFGGAFGGDGASPNAAALANPTGVSVDAAGNIYIADTNNQRIRQIGGGAIATVAGTGQQGFGGENGPAAGAILNAPKSAMPDASGNLAIADTLNQRVRSSTQSALAFVGQMVGVASAAQPVTLSNTGTASITVSTITFAGAFTVASGGTCSATPFTLSPGASCTEDLAYLPTAVGATSGSVVFGGSGLVPQRVLLTGTSGVASTATTLTSSASAPFVNQPITFTATVQRSGAGTAGGTVTFYANGLAISTAQPLNNGSASVTTSFATSSTYSITAIYAGDANDSGSAATALTEPVSDFNLAIVPQPSNPGGSINQTVEPGRSATFNFTMTPLNGRFAVPVTLSATGLPPGATVTFDPQTVTPGTGPATFTMTVHTAAATAMLKRLNGYTGSTMAMMLLLLPAARRRRKGGRPMNPLLLAFVGFAGLVGLGAVTGCGSGSGLFGQPQKSYTISVAGTATSAQNATLQHITTVILTVQ
jgi:sugar lactone lactonase YvrE